ncbi:MAG TPA: formylglycine-generating enzyme family protein [Devosia sp.]|jgi:formylglycine-generating enzyme required for sulfatase activity|uniref:formylglycine-generating enzyme family protein n=1 Tax=Devosia sp. TaxID=1871048 RepID=UPI002DDCCA1F|nr:formylglycine-generating enzyme family protein [Devosia sp.]HEV2515845.1 formylglycine-generating enzyme family protein [Devosia sp.]
MTQAIKRADPTGGLLLPALLLAALTALIFEQSGAARFLDRPAAVAAPRTVLIAPRAFSYRAAGDFLRDGVPADGPVVTVAGPAPLEIMKFEVSAADYARCVADGACHVAEPRRRVEGDVPATGVSFNDATDYAQWLSAATGETWRLPSIEEWSFAAGSQAVDHALLKDTDSSNPADRWLALYEKEATVGIGNASAQPEPLGAFGENEFGIADLGGTVWEWTTSCNARTLVDGAGTVVSTLQSCGVRYLEGQHRTPMSAFIRDGRSGGCSVGVPPDNLGFRLVRKARWYEPLGKMIQALFAPNGADDQAAASGD